jgi:hypothetical protein
MINLAYFRETNLNYKRPSISKPSKSSTNIWLFLDIEGTTKTSIDVIKSIRKELAKVARDDMLLYSLMVLSFSLNSKL